MLEIFQKIVSTLTGDATLTAIVPTSNIFTGAADVVLEKQGSLSPFIILSQVSEISRTVPSNVRDTQIQIDIWSRNSQLEVENIYERIITLLNYLSGDQGTGHIFWERSSGAVDLFEVDRRVWHRSVTFMVWSQKP